MDYQQQVPLTQNLTTSVLAAGTTTTISQTNAATFCIGGKLYTQASAWTNQATPTTDWGTGNPFIAIPAPGSSPNLPGVPNGALAYGCIYAIGMDNTKAMRVTQGMICALDVNGKFITSPGFGAMGETPGTTWPPVYNNFCPIGYVVVTQGTTSAAWTFGTSNWTATAITATFVDVNTLPHRPQVS